MQMSRNSAQRELVIVAPRWKSSKLDKTFFWFDLFSIFAVSFGFDCEFQDSTYKSVHVFPFSLTSDVWTTLFVAILSSFGIESAMRRCVKYLLSPI